MLGSLIVCNLLFMFLIKFQERNRTKQKRKEESVKEDKRIFFKNLKFKQSLFQNKFN